MKLTTFEKWATAALLYGTACLSCAPAHLVPMAWRPDTRRVTGFYMDSSIVHALMDRFRAAAPNEAAFCLDGELRDTTDSQGASVKMVYVSGFRPIAEDSADANHVWWAHAADDSCGKHIGITHDHPQVPPSQMCDHSWPDASALFDDTRAVLSVVFCPWGHAQLLMQDGRRIPISYLRDSEP